MNFHPVQIGDLRNRPWLPKEVTLRAYEVYRSVFSDQLAMVTGSCRGGFGAGELIAFLYARSFPKEEWTMRVEEALRRAPGESAQTLRADNERLRAVLKDALDTMEDCARHGGAPESIEWGALRAQIAVTKRALEQAVSKP